MLLELDKETKYMLYEPNERSKDINITKNIIKRSIKENDLILIVLDNKDNIIGFLSAKRYEQIRVNHIAYVVVGIREKFRGMGIGKELFSKLDLWAKENKLKRLELTVVCSNTIAKKLYEKSGFEIEGIKKDSVIIDGKYEDEFYMAKLY
ncbi:RimJ/RimL family protein N-acetyltransferase [Eubacterium multiforme]|uniref:RimJ/RimL family protein N-acetyltransferase n=2 Tax=Eubacterium multiforme TaxID=83339 RepID=A0ABT9USB2_9FIRM|nr:RimJ/RimL family protein N-acetyltransferase [Eubacterium multiforme]